MSEEITRFLRDRFVPLAANIDPGFRGQVDGEDAVQEAVIRAYLLRLSGEPIRSIDGWLRVVARNVARAELRHRATEDRALRQWWFDAEARTPEHDDAPAPEVLAAVRALPERQREVIALYYWADQDVGAVATNLGISTGTVKSTLHRARANLATALADLRGRNAMTTWNLNTTALRDFEYGRVDDDPNGTVVLCLRAVSTPDNFATVSQQFDATDYRGRRWRLAGEVRTDDVGLAALWMRVDAAPGPYDGTRTLAFDNMLDRAPRGTTGWSRAEIVLDVAETAGAVLFGFLLDGDGAAYLRNLTFEQVDTGVPTTGQERLPQRAPGDLDFRQTSQLNDR